MSKSKPGLDPIANIVASLDAQRTVDLARHGNNHRIPAARRPSSTGGGTSASRQRSDYLSSDAPAFLRDAVRRQQQPGGGGSTNTLMNVLEALDKPRAVVFSAGKEFSDLLGGNQASWSDFTRQIGEGYDFGWGNTQALRWSDDDAWWQRGLKTAAAITGDIATDPLTYLTGGTAKVATASSRSIGMTAMRHADDIAHVTSGAGRGTNLGRQAARGAEGAVEAAQTVDRLRDIGTRALSKGKASLGRDDWDLLSQVTGQNLQGGLRWNVPGTGRLGRRAQRLATGGRLGTSGETISFRVAPALGNQVSIFNPVSRTAQTLTRRAGQAARTATGGRMSARSKFYQAMRSGDPVKAARAVRALQDFDASVPITSKFADDMLVELDGLAVEAKNLGLDGVQVSRALDEGLAGATFRAMSPEQQGLVSKIHEHNLRVVSEANRRAGHQFLETRRNWSPAVRLEEVSQYFKSNKWKSRDGTASGFEQRAGIVAGGEFMGNTLVDAAAHPNGWGPRQQAQDIFNRALRDQGSGVKALFEEDYFRQMMAYERQLARRVGEEYRIAQTVKRGDAALLDLDPKALQAYSEARFAASRAGMESRAALVARDRARLLEEQAREAAGLAATAADGASAAAARSASMAGRDLDDVLSQVLSPGGVAARQQGAEESARLSRLAEAVREQSERAKQTADAYAEAAASLSGPPSMAGPSVRRAQAAIYRQVEEINKQIGDLVALEVRRQELFDAIEVTEDIIRRGGAAEDVALLARYQSEVDALNEMSSELLGMMKRTEDEVTAIRAAITDVSDEMHRGQSAVRMVAELDEATEELKTLSRRTAADDVEYDAMRRQLDETERSLARAEGDVRDIQKRIDAVESQLPNTALGPGQAQLKAAAAAEAEIKRLQRAKQKMLRRAADRLAETDPSLGGKAPSLEDKSVLAAAARLRMKGGPEFGEIDGLIAKLEESAQWNRRRAETLAVTRTGPQGSDRALERLDDLRQRLRAAEGARDALEAEAQKVRNYVAEGAENTALGQANRAALERQKELMAQANKRLQLARTTIERHGGVDAVRAHAHNYSANGAAGAMTDRIGQLMGELNLALKSHDEVLDFVQEMIDLQEMAARRMRSGRTEAARSAQQRLDKAYDDFSKAVDDLGFRIDRQHGRVQEAVQEQAANSRRLRELQGIIAQETDEARRVALGAEATYREKAEGLFRRAEQLDEEAMTLQQQWAAAADEADDIFLAEITSNANRLQSDATVMRLTAERAKAEADMAKKALTDAEAGVRKTGRAHADAEVALARMDPEILRNELREGWRELGTRYQATDDVVELFSTMHEVMNKPEFLDKFLQGFDWVTRFFKTYAILTPGFQVRNLYGGMFNNYLAGVESGVYVQFAWATAVRSGKADEAGRLAKAARRAGVQVDENVLRHYDTMAEMGLLSQGSFTAELDRLGQASGRLRKATDNPVTRFAFDRTRNVENTLRGSLALDTMLKGGSFEEAASRTFRYHFDYDSLTDWERGVARRVIPFYTWTRNNLPLQIESIATQPAKYNRYSAVKRSLEANAPEDPIYPEYYNRLLGIRTPFNLGFGQQGVSWVMPDLPFRDLAEVGELSNWISQVNPIIKTPLELQRGSTYFADIPFRGEQPLHGTYESLGMGPVLGAVGLANKHNGRWFVDDRVMHTLESFLPWMGRTRRLVPINDEGGQARAATAWLSVFLGAGVRTNTPQQIQRIQERADRDVASARRRAENLGYGQQ